MPGSVGVERLTGDGAAHAARAAPAGPELRPGDRDDLDAGLLAASILALSDQALAGRLEDWRKRQTDGVAESPE